MANYRVLDDNNQEITQLYIPKECVVGSTFEGQNIAGVNSGAFKDCTRLVSVEFQDACQIGTAGDFEELGGAFENCSSITTVILNATDSVGDVKNFGIDGAFKNCSSLNTIDTTNIHFSDVNSGIQLGTEAFYGTAFTNFNLDYVNTLGTRSLAEINSLTRVSTDAYFLGSEVFKNDSNLTSITFKNADLYQIGSKIFKGCSSLSSITFYGTVAQWQAIQKQNGWEEELADIPSEWEDNTYLVNCYDGDTPLVPRREAGMYYNGVYTSWQDLINNGDITVTNNVVTAVNNSNIKGSLVVDDTVTGINGNQLFYGNTDLTEIKLYSPVTLTGGQIFGSTGITELDTKYLNNITYSCFSDCQNLAKVILRASTDITSAGSGFSRCSALKDLTIEEGRTNLNVSNIFGACGLEEVYLPDSLVQITDNAFDNCVYVKKISVGKYFQGYQGISNTLNDIFYGNDAVETLEFRGNADDFFAYWYTSNSQRKDLFFVITGGVINPTFTEGESLPVPLVESGITRHYTMQGTLDRNELTTRLGYTINNDKLYKDGVVVEELVIPPYFIGTTSQGVYNSVAQDFLDGIKIKKVVLPKSITTISGGSGTQGAFRSCEIEELNFEDLFNVNSYALGSFYGNKFKKITIGAHNTARELIQGQFTPNTYTNKQTNNAFGSATFAYTEELTLGAKFYPQLTDVLTGFTNLTKLTLGFYINPNSSYSSQFSNTSLTAGSLSIYYEGHKNEYLNRVSSYFRNNAMSNLQTAAGNVIHCLDGDIDFAGNSLT